MALIILALLLVVIFGPQLWARQVLRANAKERDDIEGTGAEFARHLLDNAHLAGYGVEKAHPNVGDHFDPTSRMVRLTELHHDHRSLSAIVVAAHEVGSKACKGDWGKAPGANSILCAFLCQASGEPGNAGLGSA